MLNRRRTTTAQYQKRIADLEAQLARALAERGTIDTAYGCLTRFGLNEALAQLDARGLFAVYFDLDYFKQVNEQYGKFKTNQIVRECIQPRGYDILGQNNPRTLIGRWFSGDELAGVFLPEDAYGYVERIRRAFWEYRITLTTIITRADYKGSATATLNFCENANKLVKASNNRNLIVTIGV